MVDLAVDERLPELLPDLAPPLIHGVAELTHRTFAGQAPAALFQWVDHGGATLAEAAAQALDCSILHQLCFERAEGLARQTDALGLCQVFRVRGGYSTARPQSLRVLAFMEPGDLMVNAPLDFLIRDANIQLDLVFLLPDRDLPEAVPDHDVAFIGGGDLGAPAALARRAALFERWPRPVLNDPHRVAQLARVELTATLADAPGIVSPRCERVARERLPGGLPLPFPVLIRPVGSHAGTDLAKIEDAAGLAAYLQAVVVPQYYVSRFEDYRSPDGSFRKFRVAFIEGAPFLCHMGVSSHWMIHYLNAGMTGDAAKRQDEAQAMATFDTGFARRHALAFAALTGRIGLDYFTIDCGETQDGALLVFEADAEAIVHAMDPPDLFAYKQPQMARVFDAFAALLHRRAAACTSPRTGSLPVYA